MKRKILLVIQAKLLYGAKSETGALEVFNLKHLYAHTDA